MCCNFYENDTCVEDCTGNRIASNLTDYNCVCLPGFIEPDCTGIYMYRFMCVAHNAYRNNYVYTHDDFIISLYLQWFPHNEMIVKLINFRFIKQF